MIRILRSSDASEHISKSFTGILAFRTSLTSTKAMTDPVENKSVFATTVAGSEAESAGKGGDEDCSKEYEPVVQLSEVETKTGEEDEEVLFKLRAKLFRFSKELSEWKERGTGDVRILKHKRSQKIRLLMRREKTLKICLNQYVNPEVELTENVGSDRSWVWHGVDYADGERDEALLAIRFRDSDHAKQFKDAYDKARADVETLKTDAPEKSDAPGDTDEGDNKGENENGVSEANKDQLNEKTD